MRFIEHPVMSMLALPLPNGSHGKPFFLYLQKCGGGSANNASSSHKSYKMEEDVHTDIRALSNENENENIF
jgi:hypothetical protein